MTYAEDDHVRVPFPLPGQDHEPRESWPWLPAIVVKVTEPDAVQRDLEYAVVIIDERVAEYDPTSDETDEPVYPIVFRDPSEVRRDNEAST